MITLGIDAGKTGAIAILESDRLLSIVDPTIDKKTGYIDGEMLHKEIFNKVDKVDIIALEKQFNPRGKQQAGMWTNAVNYGILMGLVQRLDGHFEEVPPQEWQNFFRVYKASKAIISKKAIERGFPIELSKGVRGGLKHGRTDAFLIGLYLHKKQKFIGDAK